MPEATPAKFPVDGDLTTTEQYLARFNELGVEKSGWLGALRDEGISRFVEEGFPGRKNEDWKYTNVASVTAVPFSPAPAAEVAAVAGAVSALKLGVSVELVFVNGRFAGPLSSRGTLPSGVSFGPLTEAFAANANVVKSYLEASPGDGQGAFPALNSAFFSDGAFVHVPRDVRIAEPVHLLFFSDAKSTGTFTTPRVLIVTEPGSEVTVVESYSGAGREEYFTNAVTQVNVAENSSVHHLRVQEESPGAFHVGTVAVRQARDSQFSSRVISLGGRIARTAVASRLEGEGAECVLNGLYLASGKQHLDHRTTVDHLVPRGSSRELYKGILDGQATGVFNGKVFVRPAAQKSDAQQMNRNLLLSESATINTKPQLEIFADDVKCSHGATIGRLDDEALFYLRSRGVDVEAARALLVHAFANEMIEPITVGRLRERLRRALSARFGVDLEDAQ